MAMLVQPMSRRVTVGERHRSTVRPCMPKSVRLPRLREFREAALLTQEELAQAAGVVRNTVVRAEAGDPVLFSSARKLAAALGVPHRELLPTPD